MLHVSCCTFVLLLKRHMNISVLVRVPLRQARDCPGTNSGFLLILHNGSPVCPRDEGQQKSLCVKSLCALFARFLFFLLLPRLLVLIPCLCTRGHSEDKSLEVWINSKKDHWFRKNYGTCYNIRQEVLVCAMQCHTEEELFWICLICTG